MAKLPATSMKNLDRYVLSFGSLTKIKDFKFEDFESRAEELEVQNPTQGYQLAYEETMTDMFGKILDRHARYEQNVPSLNEFVQYYDSILMSGYFMERKAQNIGVNIRMSTNGPRLEALESFYKAMYEHPATSVVNRVSHKFDSGELTLESTHNMVKAKAKEKAVPTKAEALELVACATVLEKRNKDRSILRMLISLPTHFKERSAIKAMKALASKCGNIADLNREAKKESEGIKSLRADVESSLSIAREAAKPIFTAEEIKEINEGYKDFGDDKSIDSSEPELEDMLNESLDLENTDGGFITDDADGKTLFGDESELDEIQEFEKVEFNEEDIDIFPGDIESKKAEINEPVKDNHVLH